MNHDITSAEKKLLFALLDAADDAGRLRGSPARTRWTEAKKRVVASGYQDSDPLWELLDELDRAGALEGSWMQKRWRGLKGRTDRAAKLARSRP